MSSFVETLQLSPPASLISLFGNFPELYSYMPPGPPPAELARPTVPAPVQEAVHSALNDLAEWRAIPEARAQADLIALHLLPLIYGSEDERGYVSYEVWDEWREQFETLHHHFYQLVATLNAGATPGSAVKHSATLIVHGTAAKNAMWWREDPSDTNNFWAYINSHTGDCIRQGNEFSWSGGVTDLDRRQGADLLLNWWQSNAEPDLRIIAHSHGGNVVFQAMKSEDRFRPNTIITLGTPICFIYPIVLGAAGVIHNVYSEHDWVQVPGANLAGKRGEGRTLPDSRGVLTNHHIPYWSPKAWGVHAVGHSDLHEPDVWRNHRLHKLL